MHTAADSTCPATAVHAEATASAVYGDIYRRLCGWCRVTGFVKTERLMQEADDDGVGSPHFMDTRARHLHNNPTHQT